MCLISAVRGRTIKLNRGDKLIIISTNDYANEQTSSGHVQGWAFQGVTCDFTVEGDAVDIGSRVRERDNLPDMTVIELLKTFSALSGRVLNYTDSGGITFDALQFGSWELVNLAGKVLDVSNISRRFGDFAQHNIIDFKSAGEVPNSQRISISYNIANDNINEENTLQTVPFSEGILNGYQLSREIVRTMDGDTVADASVNSTAMVRIQLAKNANLQRLCDASTSVQMRARMSLLEFDMLTPKTLLYYDGVRYTWTEAQWSKGVATLKLSKT